MGVLGPARTGGAVQQALGLGNRAGPHLEPRAPGGPSSRPSTLVSSTSRSACSSCASSFARLSLSVKPLHLPSCTVVMLSAGLVHSYMLASLPHCGVKGDLA